jgi:glutamine synthetase
MKFMKDGKNQMLENGALSDIARKAIAGMIDLAPSITAFGNTNPASYLRLVPNQEAPTNVCWGDRNRSVLIRVPLGWTKNVDMCALANPLEKKSLSDTTDKQTVEIRSADGSANIYLLMAALAVACRHGFEMKDAQKVLDNAYVNVNIHLKENEDKRKKLPSLPDSCEASAKRLSDQRSVYEEYDVFSPTMIDATIRHLSAFKDKDLRKSLNKDLEKELMLVKKYFHCG